MIDKDAFLKGHLPERDLEVAGWIVRIRGLSRPDYMRAGTIGRTGDLDAAEIFTIARGLVDPPLTEDEVATWRGNVTSDVADAVSTAIIELSAGGEDAVKAAIQSFRDEPGAGA